MKNRELLKMWLLNMDGWDIFPVKAVLPGLRGADAQVRILTIKILSSLSTHDKLGREERLALWRMIADPDRNVRGALIEEIQATPCSVLYRDDLEEMVPLLRHRDRGIRSSAMHLFLQIPHYFDDDLCRKSPNRQCGKTLTFRRQSPNFWSAWGKAV